MGTWTPRHRDSSKWPKSAMGDVYLVQLRRCACMQECLTPLQKTFPHEKTPHKRSFSAVPATTGAFVLVQGVLSGEKDL